MGGRKSGKPPSEAGGAAVPSGPPSPPIQADGDSGDDADFAGDRSAAAEDVAQGDAPENDGWSGAEDNVEKRAPGRGAAPLSDPHHRGDRRT